MSYHDFTPETHDGQIGQKIYLEALDGRRGFRYDQLGIDDDAIWTEILVVSQFEIYAGGVQPDGGS